ncbi:arylsulfatase [soil metagenome]
MKFLPIALLLCSLSAALFAAEPGTKPNILVILVDDMGWSDISCYGGEISTPNIDALAKGGLRFTQFYNTGRCSPTRASLLTGHYPHQAGMGNLDNVIKPDHPGFQGKLADSSVTMAEVLQEAGYFTAMSGKWHLGQQNGTPPWLRGFDRSLNAPKGGFYYSESKTASIYLNGQPAVNGESGVPKEWYSTDLWTDFGLKFIDEAKTEKKPFFLYLPYNAPHFPLQAPAEDIAKFRGQYKKGWDKLREERYARQKEMGLIDPAWALSPIATDLKKWDALTAEEQDRFDHLMAVYAACLSHVDTAIGRLVAGLKARGELNNTLLFFMSDNGGNAEGGPNGKSNGEPTDPNSVWFCGESWASLENTPFRRYKHYTHEGGVSTPLIVHWPAGINSARNGTLEKQPGHVIDIMSTVVDATGAKYPATFNGKPIEPMEGVSLRPSFEAQSLARSQPIFFNHEDNRAVRDGPWKIVALKDKPWELYDMNTDRTELHDLAGQKPELVAKMSAQYDAWALRTRVVVAEQEETIGKKGKKKNKAAAAQDL